MAKSRNNLRGSKKGGSNGNGWNKAGKVLSPFCWWKIITLSIISVILLGVIIFFNFFFRKNYVKTTAIIIEQKCGQTYHNKDNKMDKRNCTLRIQFNNQDGETIIAKLQQTKGADYSNNANNINSEDEQVEIEVDYDPTDPKGTVDIAFNKTIFNWIAISIFVICLLGAGFYYLFRNNALVCGLAGAQMVGDAFRRS